MLRYRLADGQIESSLLTHRDERGGFFSLMLCPPKKVGTLTNVKIDWGAMGVSEVIPENLPELNSERPAILTGKFNGATNALIHASGNSGGKLVQFGIPVRSADAVSNGVLPILWARMKIAELAGQLIHAPTPELSNEIKQVALDFGILSPFTSFVTVDASEATEGTNPRTVPSRTPSGANYEKANSR